MLLHRKTAKTAIRTRTLLAIVALLAVSMLAPGIARAGSVTGDGGHPMLIDSAIPLSPAKAVRSPAIAVMGVDGSAFSRSGSVRLRSRFGGTGIVFLDEVANWVESVRSLPVHERDLPGDIHMKIRFTPNPNNMRIRIAFVRNF